MKYYIKTSSLECLIQFMVNLKMLYVDKQIFVIVLIKFIEIQIVCLLHGYITKTSSLCFAEENSQWSLAVLQ